MTSTRETDVTRDAFLGGRLTLAQPVRGYRAGVDPVLLAAAVEARAGQSVLDLGCGTGTALFCLARRVPGLELVGVEREPLYADLARDNAVSNGLTAEIHLADLSDLPDAVRQRRFDHVIANPPYFDRTTGTPSTDPRREAALGEATKLADWMEVAARRLGPRGTVSVIQKADRLADLLRALPGTVGSLRIRALQPREGRPATLIILQARKGGRAPLILHPPIRMHEGDGHAGDRESYTRQVRTVLYDAEMLAQPQV